MFSIPRQSKAVHLKKYCLGRNIYSKNPYIHIPSNIKTEKEKKISYVFLITTLDKSCKSCTPVSCVFIDYFITTKIIIML